MNSFQRNVVALIKNALSFEKIELNTPIEWEGIVSLAKSHYITSLVYCAVKQLGISVPEKLLGELEAASMGYAIVEENQLHELSRIEEAFQMEGIDYMLLKGINNKNMYPRNTVRRMKDLDILIKAQQYDRIRTVMQKLGFTGDKETYHEYVWVKGTVIVELHKTIESPYHKDFYAYFKDGWHFAVKDETALCRYTMNKEDEFSYLFAHFAGHYRKGGIGILHFVDLWLYLQKNPDMNEDYLQTALSELGLLEFYKNVVKTLNVWFANGAEDEITDLITAKIFARGGVVKEKQRTTILEPKSSKYFGGYKVKSMLKTLFPPFIFMKTRNPILKKAPVLLPVMWVLRWFDILIFKKEKIAKKQAEIRKQTPENIKVQISELNAVGLDFKE